MIFLTYTYLVREERTETEGRLRYTLRLFIHEWKHVEKSLRLNSLEHVCLIFSKNFPIYSFFPYPSTFILFLHFVPHILHLHKRNFRTVSISSTHTTSLTAGEVSVQ